MPIWGSSSFSSLYLNVKSKEHIMNTNKIVLIAGVVAYAGLPAVAAGLTPGHYIQDGLVVQYDGIDNAGTGTHVNNLGKWVDLKGNADLDGQTVYFGSRWMVTDRRLYSTTLPSTLQSNPVTFDFSVGLIGATNTYAYAQYPSLVAATPDGYFKLHSAGIGAYKSGGRTLRLHVNNTDPRPNVYDVYTNTLCCISDAQSIRIYKDGVQSQSVAAKTPLSLAKLVFNGNYMYTAHFYSFRIYGRGLAQGEVVYNAAIDQLRFFAPRIIGSGETVAWSSGAWTDLDGVAKSKPTTATNGCAVVKNANVSVAAADNVGLLALSLEDGARLSLMSDAVVSVRYLFVDGEKIEHGIYTGSGPVGTTAAWLTGSGIVRVADSFDGVFPDVVPVAGADGWYEIGMASGYAYGQGTGYSADPTTGYHNFVGDRIQMDRLWFPSGAKLRLVGGLIIDTITTSRFSEIDTITKLEYVVFEKKRVFDDDSVTFVIPEGAIARYQPATWTFDGGKWWALGANDAKTSEGCEFKNSLKVNGRLATSGDYPHMDDVEFSGLVSGDGTGSLFVPSARNYQTFSNDEFAFKGSVWVSNIGDAIMLTPRHVTGVISNIYFGSCLGQYRTHTSYSSTGLFFGPKRGDAACEDELYIGQIEGNASLYTDGNGKLWRNGGHVIVWGGNTVHAGIVSNSVHVIAHQRDQNCVEHLFNTANCFGTGNFIADAVRGGANLYLGTNVYVTVGSLMGSTIFDYTYHKDSINGMTLDITNTCTATSRVRATDVGMLPARLSGFSGKVVLTDTVEKSWTIPVNLADGTNALYQTVGCIGSGTLESAPETGTINAIVDSSSLPVRGDYSLVRFDAGGSLLSGWTVTVNGADRVEVRGMLIRPVKDATGIYLKVRPAGTVIIVE